MTLRTPYTDKELIAVAGLKCCTFPTASWDKRFVRQLSQDGLTEKERPQVWRLFIRYRRQIDCPRKAELLEYAAANSAPDLRKLAALKAVQEKYEAAMKGKTQ